MFTEEQKSYLDRYQKLEAILTGGTNKKIADVIEESKNRIIRMEYPFLRSCKDIRNIISHNNQTNLIIPTDFLISKLEKIIQSLTRSVYDIAIKSVYTRKLSDSLLDTLKTMKKNTYTHTPILDEKGRVIGVLSESSIFNYISKQDEMLVDLTKLKILDISDEIGIKRENECFEFVPKKMSVSELKDVFYDKIESKERLGAIFVTENGKATERLLGIITPWDICDI